MLRRLGRLLIVLACACVLAQQSELGALLFGEDCTQSCPDESGPHRCPPGCPSCSCVAHANVVAPDPGGVAPAPPRAERVAACASPAVPDPRAQSIFHVPKTVLA